MSGGDAALIQASALRLANIGRLTKPLDDLVKRVNASYQLNVDAKCGFDGRVDDPFLGNNVERWRTQNSCMEDYSVGAMAWAWTAAYRAKRGITDPGTPASYARTAASNALSTDTSVCGWNGQTTITNATSRGPCTGTASDIANGYVPISMHGADSMPYGAGLFTSLGGAAVGLKVADVNAPLALTTDEKAVVQALYNQARNHTYSDLSNFHESDCYRFTLSGTSVIATQNANCGDGNTHYFPKMFPIADFVGQYAPPSASTDPTFGTFDPYLFCDTSVDMPGQPGGCSFYNSGRRAVYGTMGQSWVQSTPNFTNTGLSDYTVSLRTANGNYLSATSGGGADVSATPTSIGSNEQFSLLIRTAGHTQLTDGDQVTIQSMTDNNAQWFSADEGEDRAACSTRTGSIRRRGRRSRFTSSTALARSATTTPWRSRRRTGITSPPRTAAAARSRSTGPPRCHGRRLRSPSRTTNPTNSVGGQAARPVLLACSPKNRPTPKNWGQVESRKCRG